MRHMITALALGLFSSSVFAVDTTQCPEAFTARLSKISAYRSSVNADMPAWVSARDALAAAPSDLEMEFKLDSKKGETCAYAGGATARAKLFTITEFDHEDLITYTSDRLLVEFSVAGVWFSLFPEVESYDLKSLRLYSQEGSQRSRIRTRLVNPVNGKRWNYDVGLGHIKTH